MLGFSFKGTRVSLASRGLPLGSSADALAQALHEPGALVLLLAALLGRHAPSGRQPIAYAPPSPAAPSHAAHHLARDVEQVAGGRDLVENAAPLGGGRFFLF